MARSHLELGKDDLIERIEDHRFDGRGQGRLDSAERERVLPANLCPCGSVMQATAAGGNFRENYPMALLEEQQRAVFDSTGHEALCWQWMLVGVVQDRDWAVGMTASWGVRRREGLAGESPGRSPSRDKDDSQEAHSLGEGPASIAALEYGLVEGIHETSRSAAALKEH